METASYLAQKQVSVCCCEVEKPGGKYDVVTGTCIACIVYLLPSAENVDSSVNSG